MNNPRKCYYDLNVPIPGRGSRRSSSIDSLLERLSDCGYSVVALTHNVYGKAELEKDRAEVAIPFVPSSISSSSAGSKRKRPSSEKKGDDGHHQDHDNAFGLRVLKRLNVVLEDLSHLSHYASAVGSSSSATSTLLHSYDIVSVVPRTESVFSAVCATSRSPFDVISVDYGCAGGGRLPYTIRTSDLRNVNGGGGVGLGDVALELCYAPSTADSSKRRSWIRVARELRTLLPHVGSPLPVVVSSGARALGGPAADRLRNLRDGDDLGALALRTPGDVEHVTRVVLGIDAPESMRAHARAVVERGRCRRERGANAGRKVGVRAADDRVIDVPPRAGDAFGWARKTRTPGTKATTKTGGGTNPNEKREGPAHKETTKIDEDMDINSKGGGDDGFLRF